MLTLSPSQAVAVEGGVSRLTKPIHSATVSDYETRLTGAAGTGKTQTMLALLDALEGEPGQTVLMAPTWRAARQLEAMTGRPARSIHSTIYAPPKRREGSLSFTRLQVPDDSIRRAVVDEASMVGTVLTDGDKYQGGLRAWAMRGHNPQYARAWDWERRIRLFVVGDKEQLMPVKDTWGFDLSTSEFNLTEVFRQALDSPALDLATRIRSGKFAGWRSFERWEKGVCECFGSNMNSAGLSGVEKLVVKVIEGRDARVREQEEEELRKRNAFRESLDAIRMSYEEAHPKKSSNIVDAAIICWTNNERASANAIWRNRTGLPFGEMAPGERLLSFSNFSGVCNGDLVTASAISEPFIASYRTLGLRQPTDRDGKPNGAKALQSGFPCVAVRVDGFATIGETLRQGSDEIDWNDDGEFFEEEDEFGSRGEHKSSAMGESSLFASISDYTHFVAVDSLGSPVPRRMDYGAFYVAREIPLLDAEYGYAMTAHKAQGSSIDTVGVCAPNGMRDADELRRWLYTAVTRVKSRLFILA